MLIYLRQQIFTKTEEKLVYLDVLIKQDCLHSNGIIKELLPEQSFPFSHSSFCSKERNKTKDFLINFRFNHNYEMNGERVVKISLPCLSTGEFAARFTSISKNKNTFCTAKI